MKACTILRIVMASLFSMAAVNIAHATVIGGNVTSGSGSFNKLSVPFSASTPDNTVGEDTFDDPNLYAFDEDQNINITSGLTVDEGTNPQAGDTVASHYVFFDPGPSTSQVGWVDFDADIFGIATSTANLAASDFLANTGVSYENPTLRGLEGGDSASIDGSNPRRLRVDWTASSPGDYVRVLTERSRLAEVPEPGVLAMFGVGLAGIGFAARRKSA